MRWPEERIRTEMRRLDRKTGLHGSDLAITFNNSICYLGMYYYGTADHPPYFVFSRKYFENDNYPDSTLTDVVRHEYAHHMVDALYPGLEERVHGRTWKKCCVEIGADPVRLCNVERALARRRAEKQQQADAAVVRSLLDDLHLGDHIRHPSFGEGVITGMTPNSDNPLVAVTFSDGAVYRFPAGWLIENCSL